ncbi:14120_t:CDS:1 [Cetraspora pellucida]|uniref:14120_t:CDS:1 n=1 Tax=Cetraspora pellucida TaxID=1433469 RepID=A0A9N9D0E9_9GLOM|nr:14120_t:CDS:1 [Cetraspora pellucida]
MLRKNNKHPLKYSINDYICIAVSRIDCNAIDQPTLPCKVIEELPKETYRLQCKSGILETIYNANEIIPLGPLEYEELEVCQDKIISVQEAARMQSVSTVTGTKCNCKGECKINSCSCRRSNLVCGNGCHPHSNKCKNREHVLY